MPNRSPATAGATAACTAAPSAPAATAAASEFFDDVFGEPNLARVGNQHRQVSEVRQLAFLFLFLVFVVIFGQLNVVNGEGAQIFDAEAFSRDRFRRLFDSRLVFLFLNQGLKDTVFISGFDRCFRHLSSFGDGLTGHGVFGRDSTSLFDYGDRFFHGFFGVSCFDHRRIRSIGR